MSALAALSNADASRMKSELQDLRRRGALRTSSHPDADTITGSGRSCTRCRAALGWIVNRGAVCQACRLRVCKACREYTVRTVEWVCTVCYKRSQIQTATGEWMNEFIKKPGQWKDSKFYISAADIIKSTIRRSWTICDPNSRWTTSRDSPDFRPYSSLPRGRDVSDYPSLLSHQSEDQSVICSEDFGIRSADHSPRQRRVSQFERTLSELYGKDKKSRRMSCDDKTSDDSTVSTSTDNEISVAPLPKTTGNVSQQSALQSNQKSKEEGSQEKHVSFDDESFKKSPSSLKRSTDSQNSSNKTNFTDESIKESILLENIKETDAINTVGDGKDNVEANEFEETGKVFRKVTIKKKRHEFKRTQQAFDEGIAFTRRCSRITDAYREEVNSDSGDTGKMFSDSDEYKLVFISSDSSSKEEDLDDDSVSSSSAATGQSITIDDCDWDYFEPSAGIRPALCWSDKNSPFGSPIVFRKTQECDIGMDEDATKIDAESSIRIPSDLEEQTSSGACQNCGQASTSPPTQYVPIPVLVPIPVPVWNPLDPVFLYNSADSMDGNLRARLRAIQQNSLWPGVSQASLISALINSGVERNFSKFSLCEATERKQATEANPEESRGNDPSSGTADCHLHTENNYMSSSEASRSSDTDLEEENANTPRVRRSYNVTVNDLRESDDALPASDNPSDCDEEEADLSNDTSSSGSVETDSDDTGTVADQKTKKFSKVFVVNTNDSSSDIEDNTDSSKSDTSDNDTDTEKDCVVLNYIRSIDELDDDKDNDCDKNKQNICDQINVVVKIEEDFKLIVNGESASFTAPTNGGDNQATSFINGSAEGGEIPGVRPSVECESPIEQDASNGRSRYTSFVMITPEGDVAQTPLVHVVPSDTTTILPPAENVIVQHTNWQKGIPIEENVTIVPTKNTDPSVKVITSADTLSAVVCLEEGLADDDSWVEDVSHDEDEFATSTATDSSSGEEVALQCTIVDQEEELRGYHRSAIDFTLHTIVEESCEESEVEQNHANNKNRPTSATDLEKYFFFRLGDGSMPNVNDDACSETSSIYSEGMDSSGNADDTNNDGVDPADLASSRLEKYFLSGFMGFKTGRRDSDGSVGSDSEGRPSPEQRRKRLVRARGTGRSHSSSLDNLITNAELSSTENANENQQINSEISSSSETDTCDDPGSGFEKSDGQFDTVKRKKCKKQRMISGGSNSPHDERKLEITVEDIRENISDNDDGHKTPQPEFLFPLSTDLLNSKKQQSRDSGFVGSCDDLIKEQKSTESTINNNEIATKIELKNDLEKIIEEKKIDEKFDKIQYYTPPPATTLTRKDSFNNWSSDEETNLMMSKMRQFFKTMVANTNSKPTTPILNKSNPSHPVPSPRTKNRSKPPQLVYFENELTRLMKTVPGIRDDQVREIVEYLSSEDTWSDSYDSSDYTSSDLEGTAVAQKSVLQQQISDSCQQIINKFDKIGNDEEGDVGDGGILDESQGLNRETAFVYQKLVASFNKMTTDGSTTGGLKSNSPNNSPPLIAKVMHHIGSRLVALMHEVSSGESHCSVSPKGRHYHRRLHQKLSSASTTEDDDSTSDSNFAEHLPDLEDNSYNILPRSKSHDVLLGETKNHHQSSSGVSDIAEEKEASDYERFSWRGSFESALLATDSRTKLSLLGAEGSSSNSALAMAAKRRSAGDLLFSPKSLSREQLDRVRSCGSIGGENSIEDKHWLVNPGVRPNRRRSSVPDTTCGSGGSADGEDDDDDDLEGRSTLPRSLQTNTATTNSLPRLPTSSNAANMQKAQSMHYFLQHNVKSARYRPPGFNRTISNNSGPKRAVSAPGLQPSHPRRETRRRSQQTMISSDDVSLTEFSCSPIVGPKTGSKSASPSPIHGNSLTRGTGSLSSADWQNNDDDIDRLVALHQNRSSLSSLGLRSDSMASVYSGAGEGRYGIVAVRGQVEFGLQYNYKAGALEIHIKQCKDLAAVDMKRNRSDPYVKVYLLPDKSKSGKRKTKVKKHTLNPVFDECLKFHLSLSGLETRTLWLTVWHSDMFGRNDFLGEVMMPLENKVFDDPTPKWYTLQERTEPFEDLPSNKGDIIIGLKFVPPDMTVQKKGKRSRGTLHVLVKEAKSLTAVKANGTSDPFCKSYLLPDKGRLSKQKTPIIRRTTNPVWNHTFVYDDVTLQELAERALELTVWDHDRLASNEFLGGVRFSLGTNKYYGKSVDWMDATGKELSLWQSMLERPNFWVEGCVSLRPSLDNRHN